MSAVSRSIGVWGAFVLVHVSLGWICLGMPGTGIGAYAIGLPLGDVTLVYQRWVEQALAGDGIPGIDGRWVYPAAALLPLFAAMAAGPENYGLTWLLLVTVLNAAALAVLLGRHRSPRRVAAAWWWIAFTAALGPISLARIDSITVPLAIIALLVVAKHPRLAGTLLALATWIKVWPAAIIAAIVIASRRRWDIVVAGLVTSAVIALIVTAAGGSEFLFGFVAEQADRGLQIEAPAASWYLWLAALGSGSSAIYYSTEILTFQVQGPNVDTVAAILTPVSAVAAAGVALIGLVAVRRGAPVVQVLPPLALALVVTLMLVNKVGSPQFVTWLVAPVVLGIVWRGRRYLVPALIALAVAVLTHLVYPYLYGHLLRADPVLVAILTVRNLGYAVLLGWAIVAVAQAGRRASGSRAVSGPTAGVSMETQSRSETAHH
ncbi:glycosyltransferase 87 family protein [Mycetocola zhujimingii]|uniref:DUF2029 domain-containing protein n=1 Tax=Mycetocola zhujimingii TaxID=2079792 RepID=A0A2U1TEP6_9MICO|nr:glycosyltransferase 87 family protein [Mycetocola zhujimingii]PWC07378.1 hypothetical protein DF223_07090 [Mycetocola zhujimingii]